MDKRDLPFSVLVERHRFANLLPVACALCLTNVFSISIISAFCPCWSWLAFSRRSILASLSSAIFFTYKRVRYREQVVCLDTSVVLDFIKTLRCKFISYLESAERKRLS